MPDHRNSTDQRPSRIDPDLQVATDELIQAHHGVLDPTQVVDAVARAALEVQRGHDLLGTAPKRDEDLVLVLSLAREELALRSKVELVRLPQPRAVEPAHPPVEQAKV